jgi:pilus assembly protein CpaE
MQLTLPFVRDANRMISAFRTLGYSKEKIRLLVNRLEKSSELKLSDVERSLGLAAFQTLPNSYEAVAAAVNHGRPIASFARTNPVTKGLQELAQSLIPPAAEATGLLGKLLRRG